MGVLLGALVVIQFIRPTRNSSAAETPNSIAAAYTVPADVQVVLQRACYDCHSNNTTYPWYSNVQPMGWWLQYHIDEGKNHLNFSEFATYSPKRKAHKLEEVAEAVTEGWMPLESYTVIHKDAVLTKAEATLIANWARGLQMQIEQQ